MVVAGRLLLHVLEDLVSGCCGLLHLGPGEFGFGGGDGVHLDGFEVGGA